MKRTIGLLPSYITSHFITDLLDHHLNSILSPLQFIIVHNLFSIQMAHILINKNTRYDLNSTLQQHVCLHSLNPTIHHTKHITQQEYKAQVPQLKYKDLVQIVCISNIHYILTQALSFLKFLDHLFASPLGPQLLIHFKYKFT